MFALQTLLMLCAGHLWDLAHAGYCVGPTDRGSPVDVALLRVHQAHGAREPGRLVGSQHGLVNHQRTATVLAHMRRIAQRWLAIGLEGYAN